MYFNLITDSPPSKENVVPCPLNLNNINPNLLNIRMLTRDVFLF